MYKQQTDRRTERRCLIWQRLRSFYDGNSPLLQYFSFLSCKIGRGSSESRVIEKVQNTKNIFQKCWTSSNRRILFNDWKVLPNIQHWIQCWFHQKCKKRCRIAVLSVVHCCTLSLCYLGAETWSSQKSKYQWQRPSSWATNYAGCGGILVPQRSASTVSINSFNLEQFHPSTFQLSQCPL